jgi:E3 ubiquitin-protein ligase UBR4
MFCTALQVGSKSKIVDMVALRHSYSSQEQKTTLILLCEDGSLKIYVANADTTYFWLASGLRPVSCLAAMGGGQAGPKPQRKRKAQKVRLSPVMLG